MAVKGATAERIVLSAALLGSSLVLATGAYLAWTKCEPHWMNRAGAAIVIIQVLAGVADYRRRKRLGNIVRKTSEELGNSLDLGAGHARSIADRRNFLESEVSRSESRSVTLVLALAAIGELLHGFGDLIFAALRP